MYALLQSAAISGMRGGAHMKPTVDWSAMTNAEYREFMQEGREYGDEQIRMLMEGMGASEAPKGPGRPRKNGFMQLSAADPKEDATST